MAKSRSDHLVILSDLHVGSTVGVWPGKHRIEGGGKYEVNQYQLWLYACWKKMLEEVASLSPRPIVVLNGDLIQGVNMKDGQLVTGNKTVQVQAALQLLRPLRKAARRFYMVRGTEWHDGKAAEDVESLAIQLKAKKDPATEQSSWWELYLEEGWPTIHFAHHVGMSSVPWYESTVPLRDALMLMAEIHRFYGAAGPNVRIVVRSHRHRFIHVDVPPDIHVLVTPAWQLKTAFSYKKSSSMLPQIGYVLLDREGKDVIVRKRIFQLPAQHVEGARRKP